MNKNISTAGRPLPGMARMVKPEIIIEGKIIRHFKHFILNQSARTHHSFELTLPHDALDHIQNHQLQHAQRFLGKRITIVFRYKDHESDGPERTFVGVVTRVAFSQQQMSLGDIILRGGSPTLLLDAAPHFQSFGGEKPVNTAFIAQSIISQGLGSQKFDIRIDTQNKSYISYSSQYNETHYNYLARLAEAYGEQFYYDGHTLHFGKLPPHEKPLTLTYGSSVSKVSVELNTVYTKPAF
ncbi:contractile injection system protein, VgrG/Pvc8 family, partial [uncultured Chryseobacterium sp.]|uniref:contractile injection system protein, VgrG/Pvc8 family n=1 Tax=uncultured Chryseobacterium sp. TaxID=259322 RepID=UPI0025FCF6C9